MTQDFKLIAKPCPCGCKKFIVTPLFGCQCSSLSEKDANELVKRWNSYEPAECIQASKNLIQEVRDWLHARMPCPVGHCCDELRSMIAKLDAVLSALRQRCDGVTKCEHCKRMETAIGRCRHNMPADSCDTCFAVGD
jgi:hypothetical protein